jgi:hypothetical protein
VSCDEVRAIVLDAVIKQRAPTDSAVLAHIQSCRTCQAASVEYGQLWTEMGAMSTRNPAPDTRERFIRRLAAERLRTPRPPVDRTMFKWVGAAAAAALVLAVLGYQLGTRHTGAPMGGAQQAATSSEPAFLLVMHEDSTYLRGEPARPRAELAAEMARWANALPKGVYIRSAPLDVDPGVWLGPAHAPIAPGDFVDGYFVIHAKDMATARQLVATCPHLKHGGRVEIHEIYRELNRDAL